MKLGKKLMMGGVMFTLVPLLTLGLFLITKGAKMVQERELARLVSMRRAIEEFIDTTLLEEKKLLKNFYSDQMVQKGAEMLLREVPGVAQFYFDKYTTIYHDKNNYEVFFIADNKGKVIADTAKGSYRNLDISQKEFFKKAVR
ncbi:MAG: cache domain-containing protein, partial [Candidatus Omnitrophica bacterium]|nr:cache domain-containing protein [Candidatus Omnitrophota bacterium]